MPMSTFQVRGRPVSRAGVQYAHLLRARAALQEAHEQTNRPQVRAYTAVAIRRVDDVISRIEGRPPAKAAAPRALLELELEVDRIRRRPTGRR